MPPSDARAGETGISSKLRSHLLTALAALLCALACALMLIVPAASVSLTTVYKAF